MFGLTTDTTCIFESVCGLTFHFLGMLKNDPDSVNSVTMVTSIYLPHFRFWVHDQMMNGMNPESCTFILNFSFERGGRMAFSTLS